MPDAKVDEKKDLPSVLSMLDYLKDPENVHLKDPKRLSEFLLVHVCLNGVANADSNTGLPRMDSRGHGENSDSQIKRWMRDYAEMLYSTVLYNSRTIREGEDPDANLRTWLATFNLRTRADVLKTFWDVRTFGGLVFMMQQEAVKTPKKPKKPSKKDATALEVLASTTPEAAQPSPETEQPLPEGTDADDVETKESKDTKCIHGPFQVEYGVTLKPIEIVTHGITSINRPDKSGSNMGEKHMVPEATYVHRGTYNALFGRKTGMTSDDMQLMWESLVDGITCATSAGRPIRWVSQLTVLTYPGMTRQGVPLKRTFEFPNPYTKI